ncbi:MAG TPA: DUF3301 domain-containing protein [Gammaproteobacteria bacterium]|nr:DUF3301 domain-containing protein [Gammaproteobacteria bacterium]
MYPDLASLFAVALLAILAGTAWFWNDSLRARDRVIRVCHRLCRDLDLQFLDETVALDNLGVQRSERGGVEIVRRYGFEYSRTGADRWHGFAQLAGLRVESVQLQEASGTIILHPDSVTPGRHDGET